ncbi:MAG: MerR family transcriptional regulator [Ruminococcus sp.]|nr:MerR family transcriptional regulator [Ruminococcus sp.]
MKMYVSEFARLCSVSVRTLHYYDEIGLLKPSFVDEQNGYRYYDETSLERMQEILFYRELDFPLQKISEILSSENYDKRQALTAQKKLLTLKKERLQRLIDAIDLAEKGQNIMVVFDNTEFESLRKTYETQAKEKWGHTEASKEYEAKTESYTEEDFCNAASGLDAIFKKFAECKSQGNTPDSDKAQALVKELQEYITEHYYTCTDEILKGLGAMYVSDDRFKENIDKHGSGTAQFVSSAIRSHRQ